MTQTDATAQGSLQRPVNVGLVGFGAAARVFHAPLIVAQPGLRLAKVLERSGSGAKERYPWVEIVHSMGELLADDSIALIVIATPSHTHHAIACEALRAGRNVVVEKPFTVSTREADELIELARGAGRLLSVFHNRRWDGDFLTVRHIVEQGLLGRIVEVQSRFDRYRPALKPGAWRESEQPGAGLLYDLGSHLIDQALRLFGRPNRITADVRTQREGVQSDDCFELMLDYGDGPKVTLKAGMLVREPAPRFVLDGMRGSFVKYGLDPQEEALRQGTIPGSAGWGAEDRERWGTLNTDIGGLHFHGRIETLPGAYPSFYRNIRRAIVAGDVLQVTAEEARDTIGLIELAFEASRERRTLPVPPPRALARA
jgi:predicted dehydrogenase